MPAPNVPQEKATSNQYIVGLVALKEPVQEHGALAVSTAVVVFDEELPVHAVATVARVFKAAEKVFREVRHLAWPEVGIRESFVSQPVREFVDLEGAKPDGEVDGAKVWLSAA